MRAINRIFVFFILILTIGGAIISILLFQNRNLMRNRADTMAEGMADMVRSLDRESQTGVASRVTFQPRDQEADSGTLSWQQYLEDRPDFTSLNNATEAAENLAKQINDQRNHLALKLAEAAEILGHDQDGLPRRLSNADQNQYETQAQAIIRLTRAVEARAGDMIDALVSIGSAADVTVQRNEFTRRRQERDIDGNLVAGDFEHQPQVRRVQDAVRDLAAARSEYQGALTEAISQISAHQWSVTPAAVRDRADYQRALANMTNDFNQINAELIRSAQRQEALEQTQAELTAARNRLQQLTGERDQLIQRLGIVRDEGRDEVERDDEPTVDPTGVQERFPRDTRGRVVEVNPRFGFVIIDLGHQDKVGRGLQLLVDRDGQFIARLEVTEVRENTAVADVVPRIMIDQIQAGDQVISP